MKFLKQIGSLVCLVLALFLAGCATDSGPSNTAGTPNAPIPTDPAPELIRAGDMLNVTFSDLPPPGLPEYKDRVKDDGSILLPLGVKIQAAGKTAGQLQQTIEASYVPKYYKRLTVSIRSEERFYFVGGEVRQPNRQPFYGAITVLRAIDSAGGFTEFANKKRVILRRVNGQQYTVNCVKALEDHNLDLPVYPGDSVVVPKRW